MSTYHEIRLRAALAENARLRRDLRRTTRRAGRLEGMIENLCSDAEKLLAAPDREDRREWLRDTVADVRSRVGLMRETEAEEKTRRETRPPDGPEVSAAHEAPATD